LGILRLVRKSILKVRSHRRDIEEDAGVGLHENLLALPFESVNLRVVYDLL